VKNGMAASPNGNSIWMATRQGLQCYEKKSARFTAAANSNDSSLFNTHRTGALCKTPYGHYWYVDEVTKTIIGFDPETKKIKYNIKPKELNDLGLAATLFEDNNHILWLCTWDYKLHTIDYLHGNTVTRIQHNKNDLSSVAGDFFWDAMQEADGTLWLGTVGGISKCNTSKSFYKVHYMPAKANSTVNTAINFIAENRLDNTWWSGTRNQLLMHYNPATSKTRR
jgi:ligand-binding sensor domain-containing protein